jgi:hypothetical protein
MAKAPQDPSSPVDAYEAPPAPTAVGSTPPPPPYSPAGYGQQAYGQTGYAPVARPTNVLAIVALVASGAGVFFFYAGPIAGIIMGHISLSQIKRTGEGGHGLALAAVIVGYSLLAIEVIALVAYIVLIVFFIGAAVVSTNNIGSGDFG